MQSSEQSPSPTAAISGSELRRHQRRRKLRLGAAGLVIVALSLVTQSAWGPGLASGIAVAGIILILAGGLGRAWSILYIGGRKTRELITEGPYSVTRNPLYLFTFVGTFGLGLQLGSLLAGCIYLLATVAVFVPVMRVEERALAERFGAAFDRYRSEVPLVLPRLARWRDVPTLTISTVQLYKSLRDSLLFLAIAFLIGMIGVAQAHGYLPVALKLP